MHCLHSCQGIPILVSSQPCISIPPRVSSECVLDEMPLKKKNLVPDPILVPDLNFDLQKLQRLSVPPELSKLITITPDAYLSSALHLTSTLSCRKLQCFPVPPGPRQRRQSPDRLGSHPIPGPRHPFHHGCTACRQPGGHLPGCSECQPDDPQRHDSIRPGETYRVP